MSKDDHFVVPVKIYMLVFIALLFLTVITILVAQVDFGFMNWFVALIIAFIKASLVVGFFMGLHWERGFVAVFFISGLFAISLFFAFVFFDVGFRGDINSNEKGAVHLTPSSDRTVTH